MSALKLGAWNFSGAWMLVLGTVFDAGTWMFCFVLGIWGLISFAGVMSLPCKIATLLYCFNERGEIRLLRLVMTVSMA